MEGPDIAESSLTAEMNNDAEEGGFGGTINEKIWELVLLGCGIEKSGQSR